MRKRLTNELFTTENEKITAKGKTLHDEIRWALAPFFAGVVADGGNLREAELIAIDAAIVAANSMRMKKIKDHKRGHDLIGNRDDIASQGEIEDFFA